MGAKELFVYIEDKPCAVVIYDGFELGAIASSPLHSHRYAEVHFTARSELTVHTPSGSCQSREGTVTFIPAGVPHSLKVTDKECVHHAFLIDHPSDRLAQAHISRALLGEIEHSLRACRDNDGGDLYAILTLLCQRVLRSKSAIRRVENRELLIGEFFANRYHEGVTLSDLAAQLNLCTKQTARLVERYMGAPFSTVLARYRVSAARALIEASPSISLCEIAQAVGYSSYSGFWKAFKAQSDRMKDQSVSENKDRL